MTYRNTWNLLLLNAAVVCLAGCGGAGGGVNSVASPAAQLAVSPPPPPPPPKSLAGPVEMIEAPTTQEFTTFDIGAPLRIRYDADANRYEVMVPGKGWDALIDDPQSEPGLFLFASQPNLESGHFSAFTRHNHPSPELRYRYASFGSWSLRNQDRASFQSGTTVFGSATPLGGVPLSGTARYNGQIEGEANVPALSGWGDFDRAPVGGTVSLNFDFGNGGLTGQIRPVLACDCEPIEFPTLNVTQTVFGVGHLTFSGKFDTSVSGANSFSGIFAGPNAQELIGKWTFPFIFSGLPKEATGVWIAKRD